MYGVKRKRPRFILAHCCSSGLSRDLTPTSEIPDDRQPVNTNGDPARDKRETTVRSPDAGAAHHTPFNRKHNTPRNKLPSRFWPSHGGCTQQTCWLWEDLFNAIDASLGVCTLLSSRRRENQPTISSGECAMLRVIRYLVHVCLFRSEHYLVPGMWSHVLWMLCDNVNTAASML